MAENSEEMSTLAEEDIDAAKLAMSDLLKIKEQILKQNENLSLQELSYKKFIELFEIECQIQILYEKNKYVYEQNVIDKLKQNENDIGYQSQEGHWRYYCDNYEFFDSIQLKSYSEFYPEQRAKIPKLVDEAKQQILKENYEKNRQENERTNNIDNAKKKLTANKKNLLSDIYSKYKSKRSWWTNFTLMFGIGKKTEEEARREDIASNLNSAKENYLAEVGKYSIETDYIGQVESYTSEVESTLYEISNYKPKEYSDDDRTLEPYKNYTNDEYITLSEKRTESELLLRKKTYVEQLQTKLGKEKKKVDADIKKYQTILSNIEQSKKNFEYSITQAENNLSNTNSSLKKICKDLKTELNIDDDYVTSLKKKIAEAEEKSRAIGNDIATVNTEHKKYDELHETKNKEISDYEGEVYGRIIKFQKAKELAEREARSKQEKREAEAKKIKEEEFKQQVSAIKNYMSVANYLANGGSPKNKEAQEKVDKLHKEILVISEDGKDFEAIKRAAVKKVVKFLKQNSLLVGTSTREKMAQGFLKEFDPDNKIRNEIESEVALEIADEKARVQKEHNSTSQGVVTSLRNKFESTSSANLTVTEPVQTPKLEEKEIEEFFINESTFESKYLDKCWIKSVPEAKKEAFRALDGSLKRYNEALFGSGSIESCKKHLVNNVYTYLNKPKIFGTNDKLKEVLEDFLKEVDPNGRYKPRAKSRLGESS